MKLKKVISGGQTGADQAGLEAARICNITTGGWAPKEYKTLDGPNKKLKTVYHLKEHTLSYKGRTFSNVKYSDETIRIAKKFSSPGEICTKNAIWEYKKPCIDVHFLRPHSIQIAIDWIIVNEIKILNVAGNSEQTTPGIYEFTLMYLIKIFKKLKKVK